MNFPSPMKLLLKTFLSLLFIWLSIDSSFGQNWSGLGGDNLWSNAGNWVGGTVPVNSGSTSVTFDDPSAQSISNQDLANPFLMAELNVDTTNGNFLFNGQPLQFGILGLSGNGQVVFNNDWVGPISDIGYLSGTSTIIHNGNVTGSGGLGSSANLTLNGEFTNTGSLSLGSNHTTTFNGTMSDGDDVIISAEATLAGSGTINRRVRIEQLGSFVNKISPTGLMTINGDLYVSDSVGQISGGQLNVNGTTDLQGANARLSIGAGSVLGGVGSVNVDTGGVLTVDGNVTADQWVQIFGNHPESGNLNTRLTGTGIVNGNVTLLEGGVTGDLTLNGFVFVNNRLDSDGTSQLGTNARGGANPLARSNLTFNGNVEFTSPFTIVEGNLNGSGNFNVRDNAPVVSFSGVNFGANLKLNIEGGVLAFFDVEAPSISSEFHGQINLISGSLQGTGANFYGTIRSNGISSISTPIGGTFANIINSQIIVESGRLTLDLINTTGTGRIIVQPGATARGATRFDTVNKGICDGFSGLDSLLMEGGRVAGLCSIGDQMIVRSGQTSFVNSGANVTVVNSTEIVENSVLRVESGATLTGGGSLIVNDGALDVQGLVIKNTLVEENGYLRGVGEVEGMIDIEGFLDPGNSAGTIKVRGAVDLKSTSTVCIEIGGSTPGTGYDQVQGMGSNSTLNLGEGQLMLSLINGYVPQATDRFDLFAGFSSITGSFGGPDGSRIFFSGGSFALDYGESSITITDFQAVPEPTALAMVVMVVAPMLRRHRIC